MLFKVYSAANRDIMQQLRIDRGIDHFNLSYFEAKDSDKLLLISPATGVKKRLYTQFAEYMQQNGYSVLTWDWTGIGDNLHGDVKDSPVKMRDWAEKDLNSVIEYCQQNFSGQRLYLLGHSFGGQALGLVKQIAAIHAICTVATQHGYWKNWPKLKQAKLATLWFGLIPGLTPLFGYFPSKKVGLGENLPKGVALQWASWGRHPHYINDYDGHRKMTQPIMAYSIEDDFFAPQTAVRALHHEYKNCTVKYRHIVPAELDMRAIGHFGFFQKIQCKPLWQEIVEFFDVQDAA